jgi:hypothetical protein
LFDRKELRNSDPAADPSINKTTEKLAKGFKMKAVVSHLVQKRIWAI